jgi:hypothetical protein
MKLYHLGFPIIYARECLENGKYNGTETQTKSGITCQRWDSANPHLPKHRPKEQRENIVFQIFR